MGILSNRVEKTELKAGDHIYSWRKAFIYAHHGIYMGEGKVVHFTIPPLFPSAKTCSYFAMPTLFPSVTTCSACVALGSGKGTSGEGVIMSCLKCFLGGGSLYRFGYGVGKLSSMFKIRGGTCSTAQSGPVEVVMERALNFLEKGFGKYDLLSNNCEDFATFCETGQDCRRNGMAGRGSSQASSLVGRAAVCVPAAAAVAFASPCLVLAPSPIVVVGAAEAAAAMNATGVGVAVEEVKKED